MLSFNNKSGKIYKKIVYGKNLVSDYKKIPNFFSFKKNYHLKAPWIARTFRKGNLILIKENLVCSVINFILLGNLKTEIHFRSAFYILERNFRSF